MTDFSTKNRQSLGARRLRRLAVRSSSSSKSSVKRRRKDNMKLSIELKEGKEFEFNYDLGDGGRGTSTMPLTLDALRLFVSLCDKALIERHNELETRMKSFSLMALYETDPAMVQSMIEEVDKRRSRK